MKDYTIQTIILKDANGNYLIPYTEKQDRLSTAQLSAVDSGITSDKVNTYDNSLAEIANKQDKLSETQLNVLDSGVTSDKVSAYDTHLSNTDAHITQEERTNLNNLGELAYKDKIVGSDITGTLAQGKIAGLTTALADKQDKLTAGTNITITEDGTISASLSGEQELPENVYTADNLIAGKNIEIINESVEGGVDEHTIALWHFNDNAVDSVNSYVIPSDNSFSSLQISREPNCYKFGNGSVYGFARTDYYSSGYAGGFSTNISDKNLSTSSNITIDCWINLPEEGNQLFIGFHNDNNNKMGFYVDRNNGITAHDIYSNNVLCENIEANNMFHLSWQYNGETKTVRVSIMVSYLQKLISQLQMLLFLNILEYTKIIGHKIYMILKKL